MIDVFKKLPQWQNWQKRIAQRWDRICSLIVSIISKNIFGATMYWQCLILYLVSGYSQLFGGKGVKNESLLGKYRIQVYK